MIIYLKSSRNFNEIANEISELANKKTNKDFAEPVYGTKATYDPQILGILTQIQPGTNRRVITA